MENNLGSMLADVSRLMRRSYDERARSIGATRPQWLVLTTLARNEGINQGGLAELLDVESITLCRMVDRLQDAGLVERRPDPADRRAWRLYLLPKAHDVISKLQPLGEQVMAVALEGLSNTDLDDLRRIVGRIRQNLARRPSEVAVAHG